LNKKPTRNTHMKTYTVKSMGLQSAPDLLVKTCIGGMIVTAQLGELATYLKANNLAGYRPMGSEVEGLKNGIFPVLLPKTVAASLALKVKGHDIEVGDGLSCVSQKMASDIAREIVKLGVGIDELAFEWMCGQPQGATKAQHEAAQAQVTAPQAEPCFDAPWS
jgi:hypothetical protein